MADRQSLKLGKIGKIPNPDAADRLAVLVADQMRGGKIVAVELLFERAPLLAHIDRAANGDHARHFIHRPNHLDGYRIPGNGLDRRNVVGTVKHLQLRREQTIVTCPRRKPKGLQYPETFLGYRTRIDVDASIERRGEFLQHQRYRGGDGALGVNSPDVDTGRPLRLPRDEAELGVAGIEPAVDE